MDSRLYVKLAVDKNCYLIAADKSDYKSLSEDLVNHVMLEFISNVKEEIINYDLHIIHYKNEYLATSLITSFLLKNDGTYHYYKLIIPTIEHFNDTSKYLVANKCFYYNGHFYFSNHDLNSIEEVETLVPIEDLFILWSYKDSQSFFWYDENVFSICKLEKCLISLQKKIINMCYTNECITDKDLKYKRDFLLDSIFVLNYLISVKNFTEAQRILDNLSSCGNICEDEFNSSLNNDCNCGSSI